MPPETQDRGVLWSIPQLDNLRFMRAHFVEHAFVPHSHDYYVIGIVEAGQQTFDHGTQHKVTVPGRVILINPGEVHTGQAASAEGFAYRAFYPTTDLIQQIMRAFRGAASKRLNLVGGVVKDPQLFRWIQHLHRLSEQDSSLLEVETLLTELLVKLAHRHASYVHQVSTYQSTHALVQQARDYLETCYAEKVSLAQLSEQVNISTFHFARMFRQHTGMPPHKYLENVRIHHAERLLLSGMPIAEVAYATGFSSQSHLNRTFKRFIGTTPGAFIKQSKIV